jgi:hypothetical protein
MQVVFLQYDPVLGGIASISVGDIIRRIEVLAHEFACFAAKCKLRSS